jgi:hypothetical protein
MKFKIGHWGEFDFNKDDAKIAVPLILLVLGLPLTRVRRDWLLGGAVIYCLCVNAVGSIYTWTRHWLLFGSPHCKSREVVLQGYQGFNSDEHYGYHFCNRCRETSILVNNRLIAPRRGPPRSMRLNH